MLSCACTLNNKLANIAEKFEPLLLLAIRLHMANIFFQSGMLKFENYLNDNWDTTVYLFEDIHPVPFLPADIAAIAGTAGELVLSVLFAFGLFGRFAALGLLVMTIIIEISLSSINTHMLWGALFAVVLVRGAGAISLDTLLKKSLCKAEPAKDSNA